MYLYLWNHWSPKGAALTHRGAVSNLLNLGFWNAMTVTAGMKAEAETPAGADKQAGESNPGSVLAVPYFTSRAVIVACIQLLPKAAD